MTQPHTTKAAETRGHLLDAAERLFSTNGISGVSNRQISEAAGQGNNFAVGYHFGSRANLLSALLHRHQAPIDIIRARMVDELPADPGLRDWMRCLVQPQLEYIGTQPVATYYGRFWMELTIDPTTAAVLQDAADVSVPLTAIIDGMNDSLPVMAESTLRCRGAMIGGSLMSTIADFEKSRNDDGASDTTAWRDFSESVVDGMIGLWTGPDTVHAAD
ncbi:TetR/AcrR family transcriptional regulator [Gordonia zhaorongruii]|uniref:TetR/AcrR family transcriptional regulator n=1 Tax=Gordonia zhaorongruii TaxID=2597659 RepID=UPI001043DCAA|nr:TetR family transcriptional regulator [Gordonia zhaorongruii]